MEHTNKTYLLELLTQVEAREGDYLGALDLAIAFITSLPTEAGETT